VNEKQQYIVLAVAILVVLGAIVFATQLSEGPGGAKRTGVFRARKGTTTNRPRLLMLRRGESAPSPEDDAGEAAAEAAANAADKNAGVDQSQNRRDEHPLSEAEQALEEAMNALSVDDAIERLTACLSEFEGAEEEARLYTSLAGLHSRAEPPDLEAAEQALDKAAALARTPTDKQRVVHAEANMLVVAGKQEQALERIEESLSQDGPATLPGLDLAVLRGTLHEESGDLDSAEAAYNDAAERAVEAAGTLGEAALNVYRQACLKLARLYRTSGRQHLADRVRREMRARLE